MASRPLARALAITSALATIDIVLRLCTPGMASPTRWAALDFGIYALGVTTSAALWTLAVWLDASLLSRRPGARRAFWGVAAPLLGGLFLLSFGYRSRFHQLPSWQVVAFVFSEPEHAARIVATELRPPHVGAFVGLTALVWLAHRRRPARQPPRGGTQAVLAAGAACAILGPGFQEPLPVEANAAAALTHCVLVAVAGPRHLAAPVRPMIPPQPRRARPNVLLLVHENLRADAVFPDVRVYGTLPARELSPFGSSLVERRRDGYFTFRFARANSTATDSSVPTILSGIDLGGDSSAHERAHSVWSLGKAVHAKTFLISAQSYRWAHFDEYFFDHNLDFAKTGTELGGGFVNDTGIDDGLAVAALVSHLTDLARDGAPFVGVMHFSGTHTPYWPGPGGPTEPRAVRYQAAVRYLDGQVARIMAALERLGLAGRTVVISTADHGEPKDRPDSVERLSSFHEETVRVPLWIRVPPALLRRRPEWSQALDAWRDRNVQNMDVLPTVRDALGLGHEPVVNDASLPGRSLVRMPPVVEPVLSGQSTCAFRAWAGEGFYLVRGSSKVIVANDRPRPRLFDLATDPSEERDLWGDRARRASVLDWLEQTALAGEERSALCRRLGAICPVTPDRARSTPAEPSRILAAP